MKCEIDWRNNKDMTYKMYDMFLIQEYDVATDTFHHTTKWGSGKRQYVSLVNFLAKYSDKFAKTLKANGA
jgi:hypothetical protein